MQCLSESRASPGGEKAAELRDLQARLASAKKEKAQQTLHFKQRVLELLDVLIHLLQRSGAPLRARAALTALERLLSCVNPQALGVSLSERLGPKGSMKFFCGNFRNFPKLFLQISSKSCSNSSLTMLKNL